MKADKFLCMWFWAEKCVLIEAETHVPIEKNELARLQERDAILKAMEEDNVFKLY